MSLIKIIANNIELDIVKETLTIIKENNSLITDYKVAYSNYPFLIVENSKTIKALGSRDITSMNKPMLIQVTIEELGEKFYGELQILSYIDGFRKVTLKYGTELLTIMDKKIADFMPTVSVHDILDDLGHPRSWYNYPPYFIDKTFPNVKWQFPKMFWFNKFGVDLQSTDPWFEYRNYINNYETGYAAIPLNFYSADTDGSITVHNTNVVSPQIYLLTPLFYALNSINFTADGLAYFDDFIRKLLIFSEKDNLVEKDINPLEQSLFLDVFWENRLYLGYMYETIHATLAIASSGNYILDWEFIMPIGVDFSDYLYYAIVTMSDGSKALLFDRDSVSDSYLATVSGSFEFSADPGSFDVFFGSKFNNHPVSYSLKLRNQGESKKCFQFDNTIITGKFLPDWTFGTYLNELKKLFNLNITINDILKRVTLDFNEKTFDNSNKEVIKKSFLITEYDQQIFDSFYLKFQNDIDTALWITKTGTTNFTNQVSDFLETIESQFKIIPMNGITATLSDDVVSKSGTGLMIYDPNNKPYISNNYLGQVLTLDGLNGIYNTYWKRWLRFRLNSMHVEFVGYFTEIEFSKIQKVERIYIDYQEYLVSSMEYSETEQSNFEVLLKLESINF